jgi:hypothetical protein
MVVDTAPLPRRPTMWNELPCLKPKPTAAYAPSADMPDQSAEYFIT